jgi:hypothetical protein
MGLILWRPRKFLIFSGDLAGLELIGGLVSALPADGSGGCDER